MRSTFYEEAKNFFAKTEETGEIDGLIIITSTEEKDGKVHLDMTRMGRLLRNDKLAIHSFLLAHKKVLENH